MPARIDGWISACNQVRLINKDMTVTALQGLFFIASREGKEVTRLKDIQDQLGCSSSTATRIVQSMLDEGKGAGLLKLEINPEKRNERIIKMSSKGLRFMSQLMEIANADYTERE